MDAHQVEEDRAQLWLDRYVEVWRAGDPRVATSSSPRA